MREFHQAFTPKIAPSFEKTQVAALMREGRVASGAGETMKYDCGGLLGQKHQM